MRSGLPRGTRPPSVTRATVAWRRSGRAGQERGRGRRADQRQDLGGGALRLLGEVVVAADHRGGEGVAFGQQSEQRAAGPHRAVEAPGTDAGGLFAADLAEELVEVEDDPQGHRVHDGPPSYSTLATRWPPPIWSIAPQTKLTLAVIGPRSRSRAAGS